MSYILQAVGPIGPTLVYLLGQIVTYGENLMPDEEYFHISCHIIYYILVLRPTPSCRHVADMSTCRLKFAGSTRLDSATSKHRILVAPKTLAILQWHKAAVWQ